MSLDTLDPKFSEYYEMLFTHWDSMADIEGHLAGISDELERFEAAKTMAIAAASGWNAAETWE